MTDSQCRSASNNMETGALALGGPSPLISFSPFSFWIPTTPTSLSVWQQQQTKQQMWQQHHQYVAAAAAAVASLQQLPLPAS